ncbi:hypothetical protein M0R45_013839 [Rubus argutus]|uniref:Uncharacterized protein n=1 Tax=Rubus argutus TaxID=59490 RepID=A0AAW1XJM7_RUBAR
MQAMFATYARLQTTPVFKIGVWPVIVGVGLSGLDLHTLAILPSRCKILLGGPRANACPWGLPHSVPDVSAPKPPFKLGQDVGLHRLWLC